ncbi:active regulator of SIRT1 isoform X1 [Parus major]|uniref:active regulator of SIRT1 isoform X1 n=1 Tax=Parus major TaxID=9157 RepID=UPI00108D2E50|nr:active regulator of SIRT1 isoform X1 [Parus major]
MSASLLRRGLELLEPPGRAKAPPGLQQGRDGPRTTGAARRRKRAPEAGRNRATVKGRVVKSAIEEYHKKKPVNHLRENLRYMLKGRLVADKAVTEQPDFSAQWKRQEGVRETATAVAAFPSWPPTCFPRWKLTGCRPQQPLDLLDSISFPRICKQQRRDVSHCCQANAACSLSSSGCWLPSQLCDTS